MQLLRKLAMQYGVLPLSFDLRDVVHDGRHPVSGGGFAVRLDLS